jgi:hypothetical protein
MQDYVRPTSKGSAHSAERGEIDIGAATTFLDLIDPLHRDFSLRALHATAKPTVSHRSFADDATRIATLNRMGFNMYVVVNETDGKGQTNEHFTRIRAVWQEDDTGIEREYPLEPSIVVQSSEGKFHRYWLVADDWPCDEKGIADFDGVMARMVKDYGCDKNAKDRARILRLPGFLNWKYDPPHLVQLLHATETRYTRQQILEEFPPILKAVAPVISQSIAAPAIADQPNPDWEAEKPMIGDALRYIPAHDRKVWLDVGMSIHDASGGIWEGYQVWLKWSKTSEKFDWRGQKKAWESFGTHKNPRRISSLYRLAKE